MQGENEYLSLPGEHLKQRTEEQASTCSDELIKETD